MIATTEYLENFSRSCWLHGDVYVMKRSCMWALAGLVSIAIATSFISVVISIGRSSFGLQYGSAFYLYDNPGAAKFIRVDVETGSPYLHKLPRFRYVRQPLILVPLWIPIAFTIFTRLHLWHVDRVTSANSDRKLG